MTRQRDLGQPTADPSSGSAAGPGTLDLPELSEKGAFRLRPRVVVATCSILVAVLLLSTASGAAGLPVSGVVRSLLNLIPGVSVPTTLDARSEAVLLQIRLPRTILGMLVGAALGMAGASFQGVFRNPLADPYLLGVSAGAGFGAVLALGFGLDIGWGAVSAVPAAAFLGAIVAVLASVLVARGSWTSPATLLLSGVAVAALFSAAQTYALQRLDETKAREVLSWLFGRLATSGWDQVLLLLPYVLLCGAILVALRRHLDVLRLGDEEARSLGLNPARSRLIIITSATLLTAAAVSVSGLIAFVGLVVPHIVRLLTSYSYRIIVPLSALVGASFLALVDVLSRTIVAPAELPVGIITAFVGAPFFALVLRRSRRSV
ncbi:MAG: iron ABC transporter permease [Ornithinimicrobium sp.]